MGFYFDYEGLWWVFEIFRVAFLKRLKLTLKKSQGKDFQDFACSLYELVLDESDTLLLMTLDISLYSRNIRNGK